MRFRAANAKPLAHATLTAGVLLLSACAGPPFSYAEDRCLGAYNQCRNQCVDIPSGGAQSACFDRCLANEQRCYAVGDDGTGSSLAQESLIERARQEQEKEAAFEAYKARKERERAETETAKD
ncbi:MAG: hypothetical protein AAGD92_06280 [Pseudomonadota bacterium]